MRSPTLAVCLAAVFCLASSRPATCGLAALEAIDQDLRLGRIDYETALVNRAHAIFDPSRLPQAYRGESLPIKSATPFLLEIRSHWDSFSPAARLALSEYIQERTPLQHSYLSPAGHFRIHYDVSGGNAVDPTDTEHDGVPDYVESAAAIFDSVWALEVDQLGHRAPLQDGTRGGGPEYDIYVIDFAQAVYGYTFNEPAQNGGCASYIQVDNDYADPVYPTRRLDGLRVTAAHEFFHAIQFAYCCNDYNMRWWMEICSTWIEDVAYDHINDYYNYLQTFFDSPGASLDRMQGGLDLYPYGAALFAHYLEKRFGRDTIRLIWEGIERLGQCHLSAFDEAIPGGLNAAVREFALWNYFTGSRARPDLYYPEGAYYPQIWVRYQHSIFPVHASRLSVDHLGSEYIRFRPGQDTGDLTIELSPADDGSWAWQILALNGTEAEVISPSGWEAVVSDPQSYTEVVAIPTVTAWTGQGFVCDYSARVGASPAVPEVASLGQNFPNPFRLGKISGLTTIPFDLVEDAEVTVTLFSVTGQKVRELRVGHLDAASYADLEWDGRDANGQTVAAGVYFYRIQAGAFSAIQRMVVLGSE